MYKEYYGCYLYNYELYILHIDINYDKQTFESLVYAE